MKKSLKVLIASSAIMLGVSLLAGCEEKIPVSQIHEHTFSENWEASDSTHWHKATCEHTDVMSGVEDHKFGAWNTDKEPTQEAEGSKSRICTVCQYKQVAAIAKLDHTHVFAEAWSKDAEYHWHDATCHSDVRTAVAEHTWGNWTTKVEPTETTKGLKERECSVCGYVEKAEVDKTLHVHTYASEWSKNETSHWKAATCEHSDSFKDFDNHSFGEPVVVPSTETQHGSETYTCGVCGYEKVVELPLAEHTHTWSTGDNWGKDASAHWRYATCDCEDNENLRKDVADHEWSAWDVDDEPTETATGKKSRGCTVCGYVEEAEIPMLAHTHTYSQQWSKNATEHWHAATCGHNDSRKDVANHTWSEWEVHNASSCSVQGQKHRTCTVCGYVENAPAELNTEAHSYASAWTYDESTHWHAATCGHAVKGSEAAHNMNKTGTSYSYPNYYTALKCNTCGYIAKPAGKDTTEMLPSGYHTYEPYSTTFFKISLRTDSVIRLNFIGGPASGVSEMTIGISTMSNANVYSAIWLHDAGSLTTSKTVPAGDYLIAIVNRSANPYDVLVYNYTYVYTKTLVENRSLTIAGETSTYAMYEYKPQYGVDPSNGYVTIEDSDGEEVLLFKNLYKNGSPAQFSASYFSTTDANGTSRTLRAPEFIYRSAQVPTSPYRIISSTENDVTFGPKDYDAMKRVMSDPYWATSVINESNIDFYSWYSYKFVTWTTSAYKKDTSTGTIIQNNQYLDLGGLADINFDLEATCHPMEYDSTKEVFRYKNSASKYESLKITNTTNYNFSMMKSYVTESAYNNDGESYGDYIAQWTYILDSNGYRVNTARGHTGRGGGTRAVGNVAWFYNTVGTSGIDKTDRSIRFEIKPGETYYMVDYSYASNALIRTFHQSTYDLKIYANDDDIEDNNPYTMFDATYGEGVKYQHLSNTADEMYYNVASEWDIDNLDKDIFGFSKEENAEIGNDPILTHEDQVYYEEKEDQYLYAQWIDKENLIATNFTISDWDSDLSLKIEDLTDPNLELHTGDAVNFVYKDGHVEEQMVTEVWDGDGSVVDYITRDGDAHWVYFDNLSTVDERDELLYITLKTEFDMHFVSGYGDDYYIYDVDKGTTVTTPTYEDMFGWSYFEDGDELENYYLAGWSLDGSNVAFLDGGDYEPVKDTVIVPIFAPRADSKVVAVNHGLAFDEEDYLTLQILDPNLTINRDTTFTITFADGETKTFGVTEILTEVGVNLTTDGAKRSDGVILLKVFRLGSQITKEEILSAVYIKAS